MSEIINTTENISDIALAYFDEIDETLKEITPQELFFALSPYSLEYKRLYLIGDLIYTKILKITATAPEGFEVKIKLADSYTSYRDFENATNTVVCTFNNAHLNSIPLDLIMLSKGINTNTAYLEITIGDA